MLENLDRIKVRKRLRKDYGDLEPLKASLQKFGLMNPILITRNRLLIAGGRRLEAARQLGWKTIGVVVVDDIQDLERLEWEVEENVQRKDFTALELEKAQKLLARYRNPGWLLRIWLWLVHTFKSLFGLD